MKYLKYNDPENCSREDAISLLAFMQTVAKEVAPRLDADSFDEYYQKYKQSKD